MRTHTIPILFIVLTSILTGCKAGAPGSQGSGDMDWIFETPADPVDVALVLETDNTVEAIIPVEGGTITATGTDGTVYTLDIPSGALLAETTISLTPVGSIAGMPFGGEQTYAVQLSPDGLFLQTFAILTITPAAEIPMQEQILFGYLGQGSDLILAAPVVDSSEIKIHVLHFSGNGVTQGAPPNTVQLGGSVDRRLESAVSAELTRMRNQGGDVSDATAEALNQYEEQVVKPRVAAAGESCDAGELALQTVLAYEGHRQQLGLSEGSEGYANYPDLLDKVIRVCVLEYFERCVEAHDFVWFLDILDILQVRLQLPGQTISDATIREARDLTIKCLTFRLEFESTATANFQGVGGYDSSVTSEIILRYNPDTGLIGGAAELVNTDFAYRLPECNVTNVPSSGTIIAVLGFSFEIGPFEQGLQAFPVENLKMYYMPDNTLEGATIACPFDEPIVLYPLAAWSTAFLDAHLHELGEGGLVAMDWEINYGDELFAEKEWIEAGKVDTEVSEEGYFKLYHAPGA